MLIITASKALDNVSMRPNDGIKVVTLQYVPNIFYVLCYHVMLHYVIKFNIYRRLAHKIGIFRSCSTVFATMFFSSK